MKDIAEGKIDSNGFIHSSDLITEKEGYEAMLWMLRSFWETRGSSDLTDILSGGEYWFLNGHPADHGIWIEWLEAVQ